MEMEDVTKDGGSEAKFISCSTVETESHLVDLQCIVGAAAGVVEDISLGGPEYNEPVCI